MDKPLEIKGIGDNLLITAPDGEWDQVRPALLVAMEERGDFFQGAKIILDIGDQTLHAAELGRLREALQERSITLTGVLSTSNSTRNAAADLGLRTTLTDPASRTDTIEPIRTDLEGDQAVLVKRTLRSGNSIRHPGHVVILGDVNPGAEIIAGGSVIIWGRMRGMVHAGATGDEEAVVCALDLSPTQLRIAGHIAISPERKGKPQPELAHVRDGQLVAESWNL